MDTLQQSGRQILEAEGRMQPNIVGLRIDREIYDLHTPLPTGTEADAIQPITAQDPEALEIIRHSSAHVMADAVQRLFPGVQVTFGPATESGFYYDFYRPEGAFSEDDLRRIEATMREIIDADHRFERRVLSKAEAEALLSQLGESYKLEHLERLDDPISVYQHGDWADLCKGPHVPSTRFLKAFKLTSVSGAYWRGDERNPMLQRIYGTAFPSDKALRVHLKRLEEAKQRDHRKLGKELELFAFHDWAPASPFFLPRGTQVYVGLLEYLRRLYKRHGYDEVITPQVFDNQLFRTSGHVPTYTANMYNAVCAEDLPRLSKEFKKSEIAATDLGSLSQALDDCTRYSVKPMNCPGHALMFGMKRRSYRELPLRYADFGRLHRYERSGVVQGLARVRTFTQDDGHIFCTLGQLNEEISHFLQLIRDTYTDFGFSDMRTVIATRPDDRLGDDEVWDRSEAALEDAVKASGLPYTIAEGEGAFYGPKIEFHLHDALGRSWQLGTIQADFNLPERFDLDYVGDDNQSHRPVMLHRAILGSIERFMAIFIEHVGGAFPTWLAPEHIALLTVSDKANGYASDVEQQLQQAGLRVISDLSSDKLGAKIRRHRLMRIPYLAVIGEQEAAQGTLSVRSRDAGKDLGSWSIEETIDQLRQECFAPSERNL